MKKHDFTPAKTLPSLGQFSAFCPPSTFRLVMSSSYDSEPLVRDVFSAEFTGKAIDSIMYVSSSGNQNSVIVAVPFARRDNKVSGDVNAAARDLNPVAFAFSSGSFVGAKQFDHVRENESHNRTVVIPAGKNMDNETFAIELLYAGSYPDKSSGSFEELPRDHKSILNLVFENMRKDFKLGL